MRWLGWVVLCAGLLTSGCGDELADLEDDGTADVNLNAEVRGTYTVRATADVRGSILSGGEGPQLAGNIYYDFVESLARGIEAETGEPYYKTAVALTYVSARNRDVLPLSRASQYVRLRGTVTVAGDDGDLAVRFSPQALTHDTGEVPIDSAAELSFPADWDGHLHLTDRAAIEVPFWDVFAEAAGDARMALDPDATSLAEAMDQLVDCDDVGRRIAEAGGGIAKAAASDACRSTLRQWGEVLDAVVENRAVLENPVLTIAPGGDGLCAHELDEAEVAHLLAGIWTGELGDSQSHQIVPVHITAERAQEGCSQPQPPGINQEQKN